jgi:hypothetical protein
MTQKDGYKSSDTKVGKKILGVKDNKHMLGDDALHLVDFSK